MPGFLIGSIFGETTLTNRYPSRCVAETLVDDEIVIKRNTLNKFMRDKAFFETDELACVTDGMILNLAALLGKYGVSDVNSLVEEMYRSEGEQFFSQFIGSFSGALYDKQRKTWLVWTNQVGDKSIFFSIHSELFAAGSQVNYLIDAFRTQKLQLSFDEQSAYQMLTFGFMEGENTYAKEIKRLRGGQYLKYKEGKLEIKEYFMLRKHPERFYGKTEEQIIEELDTLFRKASELEYAKDEEYGYVHLSDLSGGLDARMNMWVAHSVKPRHIHFMTYCKANSPDEIIAKQLALHWNDEIIVKPLDDLSFLYEIDEIVFMNGGLSLYSGITGGKRMLEHINFDVYGIEHTGQLNDAIIGSYYTAIGRGRHGGYPTGMYSEKLKSRLKTTTKEEYEDYELYLLYTRGFRGILNTQLIRSNFTEAYTTSVHPEVLQFCMDIPVEQRANHIIYKKWILNKYPEAALYKWEKTGAKITEGKIKGIIRKVITRGPNKIKRMIGMHNLIRSGMNPIDFWLSKNLHAKEFLDKYERSAYVNLPRDASDQLVNDMKELYKTGTACEKTMVLTVLSSAKLYFGESKYEGIFS